MSEAFVEYNVRHLETKQKFHENEASMHSGKVLRSHKIVFKDEGGPDIYSSEAVVKIEPKTEEDFEISIVCAKSKSHAIVWMSDNLVKLENPEAAKSVEHRLEAGVTASQFTGITEGAVISADWSVAKVKIEPQTELEEDFKIHTLEAPYKQTDNCNTEIYRECFKREKSVDIDDINIGTEDEVCTHEGSELKEETISKSEHVGRLRRKQSIQCKICNKIYHYAMNYEKHMKREHVRASLEKHSGEQGCHDCGKTFRADTGHLCPLRMRTGAKFYPSDECEGGYIPSRDIEIHKRGNAAEKPYECHYCPKTFGTKNNLRIHIRTHTKEKPHMCSECGKNFISSSKLGLHKRSHTGERPYECPHCTKKFTTSSKLQLHKRSHTGEKPYQCSQCTKAFISSTKLNLHMRTHTGERPYQCLHCDKRFAYTYARYRHQKTHAKENNDITKAGAP